MEAEEIENQPRRTDFLTSFFNRAYRYKKLLFKHAWIPILTVGLCVGIQLFVLRQSPQAYTSNGRMIVNVKLSLPNANLYSEELNNFLGTQEELMRSGVVRDRVNARLQADPQFPKGTVQMKVTVSPKTSIFNLSAVGNNPILTQKYLQVTMEEYVRLKGELVENASTVTRGTMQEELNRLTLQLWNARQDVLAYQSSNTVVLLSKEGSNPAEYLASLTRQLAERRSELLLLKSMTLDQTFEPPEGILTGSNSSPYLGSPEGKRAGNSIPMTQTDLTKANIPSEATPSGALHGSNVQGDRNPLNLGAFEASYLEAKKELLLLKAKRAALPTDLAPTARPLVALNEQIAQQEALLSIFQLQSEQQQKNKQQALSLQIQDLEAQIKDWNEKAVDANKKLSEYETLKETEKRIQSIYDQLQASLRSIEFERVIRQEAVTILEPATPAILVSSKPAKFLGMAALIGLVLGVSILILLDKLDDRLNSCTEIEELFREPLLGQIALVKPKNKKTGVDILRLDDDRHELVESYSNLRSALIFKDELSGHSRSIVVTSAVPGDGKSMVCTGLAVTFAQAGARVLLVDADLRRGALHKHFSTPASPGFAEVLADQTDWVKTIMHTSVPNLDFLPCGARPHRPASLFVRNSQKFIQQAASRYDYCLFDTTPVMAADDVSSLAPHVDSVLMVIRSGCTSGRLAKAALDSLYLRRVNVAGLVFNGVRPGAHDYYYCSQKEF